MIVMPLPENPSEQMNSNLTFKLAVGPTEIYIPLPLTGM